MSQVQSRTGSLSGKNTYSRTGVKSCRQLSTIAGFYFFLAAVIRLPAFALPAFNEYERFTERKYKPAVDALKQRRFNQATREFSRVIGRNPKDDLAYAGRGLAYRKSGNFDNAIKDEQTAIRLNPENAEAYTYLGLIYDDLKNNDQAFKAFEKALAIQPAQACALDGLANIYTKSGQYSQAIQLATEAIKFAPQWGQAYTDRGGAEALSGQFIAAIKDCTKAISLDPEFANSYNTRAASFEKMGDYKRAVEDLTVCLQKRCNEDTKLMVLSNLSVILADHDQYQKSIEYANKALAICPIFSQVHLARGSCYERLGLHDRALAEYEEILKEKCSNETRSLALSNAAASYNSQQRYTEAIRCATQALTIEPSNFAAYNNRGFSYFKLGKLEEAAKNFDQALSLKPTLQEAYKNRGDTFLQSGFFEQATQDLAEAERLNQKTARKTRTQQQVPKSIVSDWSKIIALDPNNSDLYYNRALSYFECGKLPLSLADFKHYLSTCDRQASGAVYALLMVDILERKLHKPTDRKVNLNAAMTRCKTHAWPYPLIQYFRGALTAESLYQTTHAFHQLMTAKFYVGLDQSTRGDFASALKQLQWVVQYGDRSRDEYELACLELENIKAMKKSNRAVEASSTSAKTKRR